MQYVNVNSDVHCCGDIWKPCTLPHLSCPLFVQGAVPSLVSSLVITGFIILINLLLEKMASCVIMVIMLAAVPAASPIKAHTCLSLAPLDTYFRWVLPFLFTSFLLNVWACVLVCIVVKWDVDILIIILCLFWCVIDALGWVMCLLILTFKDMLFF